jgi:hypothetical protein
MADVPSERQHLTRKEAAIYLTRHWFEIAPSTLATYAMRETGPPYSLVSRKARYAISDLDDWAKALLRPGPKGVPPGGALAALSARRA